MNAPSPRHRLELQIAFDAENFIDRGPAAPGIFDNAAEGRAASDGPPAAPSAIGGTTGGSVYETSNIPSTSTAASARKRGGRRRWCGMAPLSPKARPSGRKRRSAPPARRGNPARIDEPPTAPRGHLVEVASAA